MRERATNSATGVNQTESVRLFSREETPGEPQWLRMTSQIFQVVLHLCPEGVPGLLGEPGGRLRSNTGDPKGGPLRRAGFRRSWWKPALLAADLPGLKFHELRHTFVALWIAAGASEERDSGRDRAKPRDHRRGIERLSPDTRVQTPEVPWAAIAATRGRLIHGYFAGELRADLADGGSRLAGAGPSGGGGVAPTSAS